MSATEAGREMDAEVCRALGIEGTVEFYAQAPGRERAGWSFSSDRDEIIYTIRAVQSEADWRFGSTVEQVTHYPRVSEEMGAAWLVVENMRERGIMIDVETLSESYRVVVGREGRDGEDIWMQYAPISNASAPLAICLAVLAACSPEVPNDP